MPSTNIRPDVIEQIGTDAHPAVHAATGNGGRGAAEGGGIGVFLKKRANAPDATAAAQPAAAQSDDPGEQRPTVAGACVNSMDDRSITNFSRFDVDITSKNAENAIPTSTTVDSVNEHREQQWPTEAVTGVNSVEDRSMTDISRFDVDITSKNAENAIPAGTVIESVGAGGNVLGGNEGFRGAEVPSTIRTSDDDVNDIDDDLTEAKAMKWGRKRVLTFPSLPTTKRQHEWHGRA